MGMEITLNPPIFLPYIHLYAQSKNKTSNFMYVQANRASTYRLHYVCGEEKQQDNNNNKEICV